MQRVTGSTPVTSTTKQGPYQSGSFSFMPFVVYILYSATLDQYYTGQTENLEDRLFRHNNSGSKSTKKANNWKLVYSEVFETSSEAVKREGEIKKKTSREKSLQLYSSISYFTHFPKSIIFDIKDCSADKDIL